MVVIMSDKSTAFCMINSEIGEEESVITALKENLGVDEAFVVYGVYDLVLKVSAPTIKELKEIVINQIRQISGVRSTLTMIVVENDDG